MILAERQSDSVAFSGLDEALAETDVQVLLFGKPDARPYRRMGVALARGADLKDAQQKADQAAGKIQVI